MGRHWKFKRWEILIRLVQRIPFLTKQELIERLREEDIHIEERTFERDLKEIRHDFDIDISYDRGRSGYFIARDNEQQVLDFFRFAGRIFLGELFRETLKDFSDILEQIKPEDYSDYKGLHHLRPVLEALRSFSRISFTYENFKKGTITTRHISPLQLREFDRRWYVVGVPEGESHIKTFGLSRMSNLKITGLSSIDPSLFEEQLQKFNRVVGLNYDAGVDAVVVRLAVSEKQYKYLETLPLHSSQTKESILPDGRVEVSYFLIPNYEFKMQVLKMGDQVEVLAPDFLRMEMIEILERGLSNYLKKPSGI